MMKKLDKKSLVYNVNLAILEGDGSFECPKCKVQISPDDESEDNYEILDTKVVNDELVELVICCAKCRSIIEVTGFQTSDA